MYANSIFLDKTSCFLYKISLTEYQTTKITILSEHTGYSFTKPAELSTTKMRVFCELIIPFWIFIFLFLLFWSIFSEIIVKLAFSDTKTTYFHHN